MVRGRARREEGHPSPVGSLGAAGGWDFPENLPPASAPFVTVVSRWSRAEVEVEVHCVILTRAMLHSRRRRRRRRRSPAGGPSSSGAPASAPEAQP